MAASHGAAAVRVGSPPSVWTQGREPTKLASCGFRPARDGQPPLTRSVRAPLATPLSDWLLTRSGEQHGPWEQDEVQPGLTREG